MLHGSQLSHITTFAESLLLLLQRPPYSTTVPPSKMATQSVAAVFIADSTAGGLHHGAATRPLQSVAADHQLLPPTVYDRGYVASPNYPGKYFLDTDCRWRLVVQRQQTIRITSVRLRTRRKTGGSSCHEFLEIAGLNPSSSLSSAASAGRK
jgi:hypothetical protein